MICLVRTLLTACAVLYTEALTVAGLAVRRVQPIATSPYVFEVDLLGSDAASEVLREHDSLASTFWPAGVPLARLLARMQGLGGATVLELGCGTGLCSLCAASIGAGDVLASDVEPVSLRLVEAARDAQLGAFPGLASLRTGSFDVLSSIDELPSVQVLIVSDLFVTSELARAVARRVASAVQRGVVVLAVDPGRSSRADFLDELHQRGVEASFEPEEALRLRMDSLRQASQSSGGGRNGSGLPPPGGLFLCDTEEGAPLSYMI